MPILGQQAQGALSVCLSGGAPGRAGDTDTAGPQPTPRGAAVTSPPWSGSICVSRLVSPLSHGTLFTAPSFPSSTFRPKTPSRWTPSSHPQTFLS